MRPARDSRVPEKAARENTAATGGKGAKESAGGDPGQPGTPRSWRQYIEENLPARSADPEPEQKNAAGQAGFDVKEKAGAVWGRFVRWAGENGRKACSHAAAAWEKLSTAAATGCERLGAAAAAGRERLYGTAGWKKFSHGAELLRGRVARHPVSPLLYVTLLAVGLGVAAFQNNYARAFELEVNGQRVGLVSGEDEVNAILSNVESWAGGFDYEVEVTLSPVYAALGALSDAAEMENVLFVEMGAHVQQAGDVSEDAEDCLHAWAISVDGVELGYAAD